MGRLCIAVVGTFWSSSSIDHLLGQSSSHH